MRVIVLRFSDLFGSIYISLACTIRLHSIYKVALFYTDSRSIENICLRVLWVSRYIFSIKIFPPFFVSKPWKLIMCILYMVRVWKLILYQINCRLLRRSRVSVVFIARTLEWFNCCLEEVHCFYCWLISMATIRVNSPSNMANGITLRLLSIFYVVKYKVQKANLEPGQFIIRPCL